MRQSTGKTDIASNDMSSNAVLRNIIACFVQFFIRFIIGIWFTRFLIQKLGTGLYGLVPLASNVTNYFGLITIIMNAPAARYLIVEMSRGDLKAANKVFNTTFWGLSGVLILILFISIVLSWSSPFIFNVPFGYESDARLIFYAVSGAFILTVFSNPLALSTYVTNRIDLRSINEAFQQLIRVGITIGFIVFWGWKLGAVSLGIAISAVSGLLITVFIWRRLTPELRIKKPHINVPLLKEMAGMGGWMLTSQLGALLFLNTELFIVNFLCGADETGKYGALLIIPTTLRSAAQLISNSLTPPMMDRYAKGDIEGVIRYVCRVSRLMGLLMALPLGLVCGFSVPLLKIWLSPEFVNISIVLVILTAHLCVNLTVMPIFTPQIMLKKVKIPGIITLVMGIINVILAVILGQPKLGFGLIGIALAGAIVLTLKNAIFMPLYGAHILKRNKMLFFPSLYVGVIGFLIIVASISIILRIVEITNIFQLLLAFASVSLGYSVMAWFFIMNREDKDWLLSQLTRFNQIK